MNKIIFILCLSIVGIFSIKSYAYAEKLPELGKPPIFKVEINIRQSSKTIYPQTEKWFTVMQSQWSCKRLTLTMYPAIGAKKTIPFPMHHHILNCSTDKVAIAFNFKCPAELTNLKRFKKINKLERVMEVISLFERRKDLEARYNITVECTEEK
jgi:hypothetical protein